MASKKLTLFPWQEDAVKRLSSGKVLYGEVGSGKTLAALVFYKQNYSSIPLYVITTAKKRDSGDWESEAKLAGVDSLNVDSWNNIKNYVGTYNAFFIFDEQRAVAYGAWGTSMVHIAKANKWIMLSGTPGDQWIDYMNLFIANGWYRNKTDFVNQHVEYNSHVNFPQIKEYHNVEKLQAERERIIVAMHMTRDTVRERIDIITEYDHEAERLILKGHRNPETDKPFDNTAQLSQAARKLVATSKDRIQKAEKLIEFAARPIVFYNFDYERDILISICEKMDRPWAQWNGHSHDPVPEGGTWTYLVQYTAGAEGWNCTSTSTMIFYSPNYSYKIMEQAQGRIDRANTNYKHLKYYWLSSTSSIDRAVLIAIRKKKQFNESIWAKKVLKGAGKQLSGWAHKADSSKNSYELGA